MKAQLVGGPFDGDTGKLDKEPPPALWAWACGNPACPQKGVHWAAEWVDGGERYTRGGKRNFPDGEVQLYFYADLALGEDERASERAREPVAA